MKDRDGRPRGRRPRLNDQASQRMFTWRTDGPTHARVCQVAERRGMSANQLITLLVDVGLGVLENEEPIESGEDREASGEKEGSKWDRDQLRFPEMEEKA